MATKTATPAPAAENDAPKRTRIKAADVVDLIVPGSVDASEAPIVDRSLPDDFPLVPVVKRSVDTYHEGNPLSGWMELTVKSEEAVKPTIDLLRRICRENFGLGMRSKVRGLTIKFRAQPAQKRERKASADS